MSPEQHHVEAILSTIDRHVLGQSEAARLLLASFLAGGHVLVEGAPGVGKTLLARCFAACVQLDFARVQFTPDLMPSDLTGVNVYRAASGSFELTRGPVFTEVLMADEINRTPPKTQAALLEAMQERQVTIDGTSHRLPEVFFVVATQNPIEFEGTYPLPEAQLDRFTARIEMGLPAPEAEVEIYRHAIAGTLSGWQGDRLPEPCVPHGAAVVLRTASRAVHADDGILGYLQRLAAEIRSSPYVELGPSPRGALSLLEMARASAVLAGRVFVTPDDVKQVLVPCWGHRVLLTPEAELEGTTARRTIEVAAERVEVPR